MISFKPIANRLRRLAGFVPLALTALADESWEISSPEPTHFPPAIMLPGQIERIVATRFADPSETIQAFTADEDTRTGPTTGYVLHDVDLIDGVLYKGRAEYHLRERRVRSPITTRPTIEVSGALYESWVGNRWFGNWLSDDCVTFPLAESTGKPVTTSPPGTGHVPAYELLLGMAPRRIGDVHFSELMLFDDLANNADRRRRTAELRARLLKGRSPSPVPGIFLLRGHTGDQRLLINEIEIAERLATERGFLILDTSRMGVEELIDACGASKVVAGIEGSQLVHGLIVAPPGAALLTIQPPDRVTAALKLVTDRLQQRFLLVVGRGNAREFHAEADEVLRTLDLIS